MGREQKTGRPCFLCDGRGCEECDGTGKCYRVGFDVDGATVSVSGSGDFDPSLMEAFATLARAAFDHVEGPYALCTCGDGSAEDDRGAVLRCPVHGIGLRSALSPESNPGTGSDV